MNLNAVAIRRLITILAVVCLFSTGGIWGADLASPQPHALLASAGTSPGLTGQSLAPRLTSGRPSSTPLCAKLLAVFRLPNSYLPSWGNSGSVPAGLCRQLSPSLASFQFGRSPPSFTI